MTAATADVIIIGAGVIGCSTAFHLAALGLKPLVLERKGIAQAATSYAAGLLTRARSKACLMSLVRQTYLDVQRLEEVTGDSLGLRTTGSLYVGASDAVNKSHRKLMALAIAEGETVIPISPGEAMDRLPWLHLDGEEEVFEKLRKIIVPEFHSIYELMTKQKSTMRAAAFVHALNRIVAAVEAKGTEEQYKTKR